MKFKLLFTLFNLTLILFLGVIILLPILIMGPAVTPSFWRINWLLILLWSFFLIAFNIFYFTNRELFILLEKEDWPALVRHLEERVIQKGNYSPRLVKLLANSYLVLSDSAAVMSLENKTAIAKPALVNTNALVFGTARILAHDVSGAVRFFQTRKDTVKPALKNWVHWYCGFAMLLNSQFEEAANEFSVLARFSPDGVVTALSSYFIVEFIGKISPEKEAEFREHSSMGRERVLKALPAIENWKKEVSRLSTEIHAAAITKYLDETSKWLY